MTTLYDAITVITLNNLYASKRLSTCNGEIRYCS